MGGARDVVSETTFAVIADAHAEGAELNNRIEIVDRNLTAAGGAINASTNAGQQAIRHQRALSESAIRAGEVARAAFEKARDEMRKP